MKKKQSLLHIETGALFRNMFSSDTFTAQQAKKDANEGKVVSVFMPIGLWSEKLRNEYTGEEMIITDGFPRRPIEAKVLDSAFDLYSIPNVTVVVIDLDDEEIVKRVSLRGREDDTPEAISVRLSEYRKETAPVLEYFEGNDRYSIIKIEGNQTIEQVQADVLEKLGYA
jgi:adenylate kinase